MSEKPFEIGQEVEISKGKFKVVKVIPTPQGFWNIEIGNTNQIDLMGGSVLEGYIKSWKKIKEGRKFNADGSPRKAMTSQQASNVKKDGHDNEYDFAKAVNGNVLGGRRKGDVVIYNNIEKKYVSVKGPVDKIQVFLYGIARFETDEFGELSKICKACIDSFPVERNKYEENKSLYKNKLMPHMEELKDNLLVLDTLSYFFLVSFFGSRTEYLAIKDKKDIFVWHIFHLKSVVEDLPKLIRVENSKANSMGQFDNQKVLLKAEIGKRCDAWVNVGEIEMRNDSSDHYRELKFRIDRDGLLLLLQHICDDNKKEIIRSEYKIILYDNAVEELKFLEDN